MIDHVGFAVTDAERSRRFYEQALAPLGIGLIMSVTPEQTESGGTAHGFGADDKPFFWVGDNERVGEGTHVAFAVDSRAKVEAFYQAALAAGGRDNGPPGLRPHYHPNYYAAFVFDPDGNNIEAVSHRPE
jgi:catechol 2,3-dioxygenase-like lactoylglutathione lyase family enzyme